MSGGDWLSIVAGKWYEPPGLPAWTGRHLPQLPCPRCRRCTLVERGAGVYCDHGTCGFSAAEDRQSSRARVRRRVGRAGVYPLGSRLRLRDAAADGRTWLVVALVPDSAGDCLMRLAAEADGRVLAKVFSAAQVTPAP